MEDETNLEVAGYITLRTAISYLILIVLFTFRFEYFFYHDCSNGIYQGTEHCTERVAGCFDS